MVLSFLVIGSVFKNTGGFVEVVQDQIKVAVAIQVGVRSAIGAAFKIESPGCGHIFKSQITPIAVGKIGHLAQRHFFG